MRFCKQLLLTACTVSLLIGEVTTSYGADATALASKSHRSETNSLARACSETYKPSPQVYGIATYDALFKYVLSNTDVRPSFFKAFIPDLKIMSSERLDDHMNPIHSLQKLRTFLHAKETKETAQRLSDVALNVQACVTGSTNTLEKDENGTAFP